MPEKDPVVWHAVLGDWWIKYMMPVFVAAWMGGVRHLIAVLRGKTFSKKAFLLESLIGGSQGLLIVMLGQAVGLPPLVYGFLAGMVAQQGTRAFVLLRNELLPEFLRRIAEIIAKN